MRKAQVCFVRICSLRFRSNPASAKKDTGSSLQVLLLCGGVCCHRLSCVTQSSGSRECCGLGWRVLAELWWRPGLLSVGSFPKTCSGMSKRQWSAQNYTCISLFFMPSSSTETGLALSSLEQIEKDFPGFTQPTVQSLFNCFFLVLVSFISLCHQPMSMYPCSEICTRQHCSLYWSLEVSQALKHCMGT